MIHLVRPCEYGGGGGVVADSIISPFVINQSWHLAPFLSSLPSFFFSFFRQTHCRLSNRCYLGQLVFSRVERFQTGKNEVVQKSKADRLGFYLKKQNKKKTVSCFLLLPLPRLTCWAEGFCGV